MELQSKNLLAEQASALPVFQCGRFHLTLKSPLVMGILNITPDSYCRVGREQDVDKAVECGIQMAAQGAAMIDVGGEPTNPNLHPVISLEEELKRVVPVVEKLRKAVNIPISVDTSKKEVMERVIALGADLINDVRALRMPGALAEIAKHPQIAVCLMHMKYPFGIPAHPIKDDDMDILQDVKTFLQARINECLAADINLNRIMIDPGIGAGCFGKNLEQNLSLINNLGSFHDLNVPILIGASRKAFIGQLLDIPVDERLFASLAAAVIAMIKGAKVIRVHDVKATVDALTMASAILQANHI